MPLVLSDVATGDVSGKACIVICGVIDKAVVTFSVNNNGSYVLFGDYNASLVVNGAKGLYNLATYAYLPEYVGA